MTELPFQTHSFTSRKAAEEAKESAATQRSRVYSALKKRGEFGATDEELQIELKMNPSTERPRRIELHQKGKVANSGRIRQTKSGRDAVVWIVKGFKVTRPPPPEVTCSLLYWETQPAGLRRGLRLDMPLNFVECLFNCLDEFEACGPEEAVFREILRAQLGRLQELRQNDLEEENKHDSAQ